MIEATIKLPIPRAPTEGSSPYAIATTPQVEAMLLAQCVVVIAVSGGKDSVATAIATSEYLDSINHTGPRILIHADLGLVEWRDSLPVCKRLAEQLGWELLVVQRKAGGMMERWETRWANNLARYSALECVKLILPWSTPSMRFCTSELKTAVICSELKKRFKGRDILSVTGVRHQESAARAKMPIASAQEKLTGKNSVGLNWNPIIDWSTEDVFAFIRRKNGPLHEAYTRYNSSRVSCVFCIMGSLSDLIASASCDANQIAYRQMVDLEIRSGFAFQGNRWLGDVAPRLLDEQTRQSLQNSKQLAKTREEAEKRIPKHLLFTKGWPHSIPSREEAELLAEVRKVVFAAINVVPTFITADSIIQRYSELIAQKPTTTTSDA